MAKPKPVFIEVKCPKCGKQFNSEEEMLKHYENCTEVKRTRHFSKKKALGAIIIAVLVLSIGAGISTLDLKSDINPAKDYAKLKGISLDVSTLNQTWSEDDGVKEKAIIDYASQLNSANQDTFLSSLLSSNSTIAQYYQVQFLSSLPLEKQLQIIDEGKAGNFDFDGDGMNNYFEKEIAHQSYDVFNGRYAIIVYTININWTSSAENVASLLIEEEKFDSNNVIKLVGNDATKTNFIQAISSISQKAVRNDLVYVSLSGHSNREIFGFNDGKGDANSGKNPVMTYSEIDNVIDTITYGKMLITISGCGNDAPLPPLSTGHSQRVVSDVSQGWISGISNRFQRIGTQPVGDRKGTFPVAKMYDLNGNGYVSFDEIFKTCDKDQTECAPDFLQMSDKDGIAPNLYFGDFNVNDQPDYNRNNFFP
jgi:hypothetical protein